MAAGMMPFPILDLQFEAVFERPLDLPPYPGSMLRGVFGASLRNIACMTGFRTCDGCPLRPNCPYPLLFEPPPADLAAVGLRRTQEGLPPPFILRFPASLPADGSLLFGMRLLGHGIDRLAYVIEAWRRACTRGLGRDRVRGQLLAVRRAGDDALVWDPTEGSIHLPPPLPLGLHMPAGDALLMVSRTPWRLMAAGKPLPPDRLTPRWLVAAIIRRARLLALHANDAGRATVKDWPVDDWLTAADSVHHAPQLQWRDWFRWSSRQQRRVNLGGYVGQWRWERVPEGLKPLLALGGALHVGKEASFGLGAIELLPFTG